MMKEQQEKLRQEYDGKLAEIERERESIEEEKAQVDRYKQLAEAYRHHDCANSTSSREG